MKRIALVLLLAFAMLLPLGASASDVPDGTDCRAGNAEPYKMGSEADRGAVCVTYEDPYGQNTTILYVGGEASPEGGPGSTAGMPCGAIIVANVTVRGKADWDNGGADGVKGDNPNTPQNEAADDEHCD